MKIKILFIVLLLVSSCHYENREKGNVQQVEVPSSSRQCNIVNQLYAKSKVKEEIPYTTVVYEFYNWYIKKELVSPTINFNAVIKKNPNGIWGLDIPKLRSDIEGFSYFSNEFKQSIINRNIDCNESLLKNKIKDPDDIYLNLNGDSQILCDFCFFDNWLGGQDSIEVKDFRILKYEKSSRVKAYNVYLESLTASGDVYSSVIIEIIKQDGGYKINNITVSF